MLLQFSELLGKFVDNNEKSWENKFGENRYGYNKDQNKQGGGWGQQGGSAGGGGQRFGHRGGTGGADRQDANRGGNTQLRAGDRGPRDRECSPPLFLCCRSSLLSGVSLSLPVRCMCWLALGLCGRDAVAAGGANESWRPV